MLQGVNEEPLETLEWNGRTIRVQPPIVGDVCITPRSGRAKWPCGYRASTCNGDSTQCPRCRFRYCQHHYPGHYRRILCPVDTWMAFAKHLRERLDKAAVHPETKIRAITVQQMEDAECLP